MQSEAQSVRQSSPLHTLLPSTDSVCARRQNSSAGPMQPAVGVLPVDLEIPNAAAPIRLGESEAAATIDLFDGGSTVPFVARYRKEATGGLDDIQLRALDERLKYLREMEERRTAILKSIEEQGKLTPQVKAAAAAGMPVIALDYTFGPLEAQEKELAQLMPEVSSTIGITRTKTRRLRQNSTIANIIPAAMRPTNAARRSLSR